MWTVSPNSYWYYKNKCYRVIAVHENKWSQNINGSWGPTVEYESEENSELVFLRERSEFATKFQPRDMAG